MIEKSLPFSAAEYDRRLAKTRAAMEAKGIEVPGIIFPSTI